MREDRDWTQQQVADMLHISRSTYSAYENGANAAPLEIWIGLSNLYDTSVDYLLDLTDESRPYKRKEKHK